eukprot:746744-Hanusia_phi.AAC.1
MNRHAARCHDRESSSAGRRRPGAADGSGNSEPGFRAELGCFSSGYWPWATRIDNRGLIVKQ